MATAETLAEYQRRRAEITERFLQELNDLDRWFRAQELTTLAEQTVTNATEGLSDADAKQELLNILTDLENHL